MRRDNLTSCPSCGKEHGLSIQVTGEYVLRLPVENGLLAPTFEVLLNPPNISYKFADVVPEEQLELPLEGEEETRSLIPKSSYLLLYSDVDSKTIITLYKEEGPSRIFCQSCKKVFTLPLIPDYLGDE